MAKQDVTLTPNAEGLFSLVVDGADFASCEGFETGIATALFTDARAPESRVPEPSRRRGWVGDILTIEDEEFIGSKLWTLDQARLTNDTVNQAQLDAVEAVQSFINNGQAKNAFVSVERSDGAMTIVVELVRPDSTTIRYEELWRKTDAARITNVE